MADVLHNIKPYNKSRKFYFPSRCTFKALPKKRRKSSKWIKLESSLKSSKSENRSTNTHIHDDTFKENTIYDIESDAISSQETENSLELSPILKYSSFERTSPVIGNKIVSKSKNNDVLIQDSSRSHLETFEIEFEEQSISHTIDQFLSQDCLKISPDHETGEQTNYYYNLYYEPPKRLKKSYVKNGLAYNLQMGLLRQNNEVSFWKHDREFSKEEANEYSLTLVVQIKNERKQCGVLVLECDDLTKGENCLVTLGSALTDYVCTDVGSKIEIYEPYLMKVVKYDNDLISCYFNISKIINL